MSSRTTLLSTRLGCQKCHENAKNEVWLLVFYSIKVKGHWKNHGSHQKNETHDSQLDLLKVNLGYFRWKLMWIPDFLKVLAGRLGRCIFAFDDPCWSIRTLVPCWFWALWLPKPLFNQKSGSPTEPSYSAGRCSNHITQPLWGEKAPCRHHKKKPAVRCANP